MSNNNKDDDIFDDSFEDLEGDNNNGMEDPGFDDSEPRSSSSLLDLWNNNPMVKLAVIGGLLVIGIGSVYAFVGSRDKDISQSSISMAPDQKSAPGGQVSQSYGGALEEQNQQKLEAALGNRDISAIPIPVDKGDAGLSLDGGQDFNMEDPLAMWQRESAEPAQPAQMVREVPQQTMMAPPPAPPQASQEQMDGLSAAISSQIQSILQNRQVKPGQYLAFSLPQVDIEGGKAVGTLNGPGGVLPDGTVDRGGAGQIQEILVPAATILYAQTLNEANSDTPGPVVAQVLSGPLVGSRVIGTFDEQEKKIIITFNTVVVDGVGNSMNGVAIDPNTTSPGLATDVDNRYFRRIVLPAAAAFVEGLGNAYAQQESQVFTTGDVIVTNQSDLNTKKEFARGVAEGAEKAGQLIEEEGDRLRPLIRVQAGTPIGIILIDPVMKP